MRMLRYSIARLLYYKKQTIFYSLFSSIMAFLLMLGYNLYRLQSTLHVQVEARLNFLETSTIKEHFPPFLSIKQFYVNVILLLLGLFSITFIFFFQRSLHQDRRELINWRLAGLSKEKIFLLIAWQVILPLLICCTILFIWIILFQNFYQDLLQHVNFWCLKLFELPDTHLLTTTTSQLSIPMDQQTFFKIDFINEAFFPDIIKTFLQTIGILVLISIILSILQFSFFYQRLKKGTVIPYEHM
ncbi:MAG: hypothetical protein IC227_07815 [Enterococcus lacertideformus]|uniref:FtsX-like permease family protein n=1 Tax=Enterococcus lacertideformus TaxID=2771493 RepID=A0A931AUU5_9ENTE|nr:hypothetical protein [Enterococcus lacertideformus]